MEKKYKLTEETINVGDKTLHRIEALRDFSDVEKGEKGGFVEKEENLSQNGNCWVYDNAMVYGNARVYDNAKVCDYAEVYDKAWVYGNAEVFNNAQVYCNALVIDKARVYSNAKVCDNAIVRGKANVYSHAEVCGNAEIATDSDYIVFKNWWSSGRGCTWTKSNNMWKVGFFYGTGEELIEEAYKDSEKTGEEYEKFVKYVESIIVKGSI